MKRVYREADPWTECTRLFVESINSGEFCLVLGAGANAKIGLPDWMQLARAVGVKHGRPASETSRQDSIHKILTTLLEIWIGGLENREGIEKLRSMQEETGFLWNPVGGEITDLPWLFELLEQRLNYPSEAQTRLARPMWQTISDSFYEGVPSDWALKGNVDGETLHFLAVLAILNGFKNPDQEVHVVSYNLDVLLEEKIAALGHRAKSFTRLDSRVRGAREAIVWDEQKNQQRTPDVTCSPRFMKDHVVTVRILHPHGMLVRPSNALRGNSAHTQGVELHDPIMTAADYDFLSNNPIGEANRDQLKVFATSKCLFFGFSFSDPNVRKLMRLIQILTTPYLEEEPKPLAAWVRHAILLKAREPRDLNSSHPSGVSPTVDELVQQKLAEFSIARLGHHSYSQHLSFVTSLLNEVRRRDEFKWTSL